MMRKSGSRSCLRAQAMERANGKCDLCDEWGTALTHIHSSGMGGTPDGRRDRLSNLLWCCPRHAAYTDGETYGDFERYREWHEALLGEVWSRLNGPGLAYRRAEALARLVERRYGWMEEDT